MPNRIIKDSFCTSEKISSLSDFEFRLWVSMITMADDAGRGDARPAIIKGRAFPLRERVTAKDIEAAVHGLAAKGCVSLYTVDGKPYFWFPTWSEHQRIRDCKPKYPGPESADNKTQGEAVFSVSPQSAATCGEVPPESNPIQPESESESNPTTNPTHAGVRTASAAAAEYLNRVNPAASHRSLDELVAYEKAMGTEVCLRAIEIGLDNKKPTWAYIKAILQRWSSEGVKCIADIETLEQRHEQQKRTGTRGKYPPGAGATAPQPRKPGEADDMARKDMENLRKFLEAEKAKEKALEAEN